jgi:hypothetical protein
MEEIAEQYRAQAESDLTYNLETISSEDELFIYSTVAEELGIELDGKLIEEATAEVARAAEEAGGGLEDYDEERDRGFGGNQDEQSEMDGLFDRLLD